MRTCTLHLWAVLLLATPAAAAGAPAPARPKVAVLDVRAVGNVDPQRIAGLTSVISAEIDQLGRYDVISGADVRALLGLERAKQTLGCGDGACLTEIGGALGADWVLGSEVSQVGGTWLVALIMVDVKSTRTVGRLTRRTEAEVKLVDATSASVRALLGGAEHPPSAAPPPPPAAGAPPVRGSQGRWVVLPLAGTGLGADVTQTFRDLLVTELHETGGPADVFVTDEGACRDAPCARAVGGAAGADVAIFGSVSSLGKKVLVTVTAVNVADGTIRSSSKMASQQVEELDAIADRIALAILGSTSAAETGELGNITSEEAKVDIRKEGARGLALRGGGVAALTGYANQQAGVAVDLSYWFEARDFAIEPRIGFHSQVSDSDESWKEFPLDVGAYYLLSRGDIAPFAGGGAGIRYMSETVPVARQEGTVVVLESMGPEERTAWGFGAFGRAGVMLFRTYTMHVAISVDYNVTLVDLHESNPQSVGFGISVMF